MYMSSEIRVKNSYESLYYCSDSNDSEADAILREKIQKAFADHDVLLSDRPSQEKLREVMLDAYKESIKELGGSDPSEPQIKAFTQDFDRFTKDRDNFYDVTFRMYEANYQGDSVDLAAEYERTVRDHVRISSMVVGQTNEKIDFVEAASKISYMGHVPQVSVPVARYDYEPAAPELKRGDADEQEPNSNRQYALNDEELESNGPEI